MKNSITIGLFILLLSFGCKKESESVSATSPLEVFADSLFQSAVDSTQIAGASALVFQDGKSVLDKSYGYASMELQVPVPKGASFEIGSVTKQFTAAAILKLVDDGKLSLDDDFTQYVKMETDGRAISVRRLLDHTSGIPSYTEIPEFWKLSIESHPRDTLLRLVESKPFLFEPGERQIYNNTAYFLLGLIIEKVSGEDYETYLKNAFFEPLGLEHTYYCSNALIFPGKVYGYNYTEEGLEQKAYLDHTWPYAAGSLCSTTADVLKWMQALHGGKVLSPEGYGLMTTPDTLNDGSPLRYAKGLTAYNQYGNRNIGHGGGINGFLSMANYYPDSDLYVICLVNTTGPKGAGYFANALTWELVEKKEYESLPMDIPLEELSGKFSGVVRGRMLVLDVNATADGVILLEEGKEATQADTLNVYVGNATWMDGNDIVKFQDGKWRIDRVGGYYILDRK